MLPGYLSRPILVKEGRLLSDFQISLRGFWKWIWILQIQVYISVNCRSHSCSQAKFFSTLSSGECSFWIVKAPGGQSQGLSHPRVPKPESLQSSHVILFRVEEKTMNYEDKCSKEAWNWSVFPQIIACSPTLYPLLWTNKLTIKQSSAPLQIGGMSSGS